MAYEFVAANSQNLSVASNLVSNYPLTVAAIMYQNTLAASRNIGIHNSSATDRLCLLQISGANSDSVFAGSTASGTGDGSTSGPISAATYFWAAGIYASTASRTAYANGTAGNPETVTRTPSGYDTFSIGGYSGNFFTGINAEVAVWGVALTAAEITSLSKGFKPYRIRPQSLVFYAPLIRTLQDTKGGRTITNNNTATVAAHPRVI